MIEDDYVPGEISRGGEKSQKTKIYKKNPYHQFAENIMIRVTIALLVIVFIVFFVFHAIISIGLGKAGRKTIEEEKTVSIDEYLKEKEIKWQK
ncbi:MAG: hypothetical protein PHQ52_05855 [Candidatus Omnitrophica bacterium]|jgi:hypothetical protein|nr:hypothetical protein [Candidatus Omnitrophota bacterium]